jgi:hypothetical protein
LSLFKEKIMAGDDGITGGEWKEMSEGGELCGVFGCLEKSTSSCPKCGNHYCYEHLRLHMHPITDEEQAVEERKDESLSRQNI